VGNRLPVVTEVTENNAGLMFHTGHQLGSLLSTIALYLLGTCGAATLSNCFRHARAGEAGWHGILNSRPWSAPGRDQHDTHD
jgi:hypothetical protein